VSIGASIATGLFTSAAAGILASLLLAPFGELRRLFFVVNGGLALGLLVLAVSLRRLPPGGREPLRLAGWGAGDWAWAASALAIVTNPKPRLRPSGSMGRCTRTTGPAEVAPMSVSTSSTVAS